VNDSLAWRNKTMSFSIGIDPYNVGQSEMMHMKLQELYSGKSLSQFLSEHPLAPTESYRMQIINFGTSEREKHERRKFPESGIDGANKKV